MIPHLDLRLRQCAAEVWLNDIPMLRLSAPQAPMFASRPVTEFVRDGENVLTVVPFPGSAPATSRQRQPVPAPSDAMLEARLVYYEAGDFPGSGAGTEAIVIRFGDGRPVPAGPVSQSRALPATGRLWAWQQAAPMALQPDTRAALGRLAAAAHDAFARRNADFFLAFGRIYFHEYSVAYPDFSQREHEQGFREDLAGRPGDPPWQVAPLVPAEFDFRLCAEGRLVELVDRRFQPLLRAESTNFPLPVFVGVVDGRAQMLR